MRPYSLLSVVLAASLTLVIGACGSNGSDDPVAVDTPPPTTEPEPTPPTVDELKMNVADAITALETSGEEIAKRTIAVMGATSDVIEARQTLAAVDVEDTMAQDEAVTALMMAQRLLADAQKWLSDGQVDHEAAQMALLDARDALQAAAPDSLALLDARVALQQAREDAAEAARQAAENAANAARQAAADLAEAERERDEALAELEGIEDAADVFHKEQLFEALSGERPITSVRINDEGAMVATITPVVGGVAGTPGEPTPIASSKGVVTIDAPEMVPFTAHFGAESLALVTDDHGAIVLADRFPETGRVTYGANTADDPSAPETLTHIEFSGTIMGARGTFSCAVSGTCTVSRTDTGYAFTSGTWEFLPNANALVTVPDTDWLEYGWWAIVHDDGSITTDAYFGSGLRPGVTASRLTNTADNAGDAFQNLTGTATYTGPALGKYAIDNRPTGNVLDAGHFWASAELVADFGESTAQGTISGTIDNFLTGGEYGAGSGVPRPEWSVSLGRTPMSLHDSDLHFDTSGDSADTTLDTVAGGTANVWTINNIEGTASGNWRGDFYHNGDARNDGTPEHVVGDFTVNHGTTAYMLGAFGGGNIHMDTPSDDE